MSVRNEDVATTAATAPSAAAPSAAELEGLKPADQQGLDAAELEAIHALMMAPPGCSEEVLGDVVAELIPSLAESSRAYSYPTSEPRPCPYPPGSDAKIKVMIARVAAGRSATTDGDQVTDEFRSLFGAHRRPTGVEMLRRRKGRKAKKSQQSKRKRQRGTAA